MPILTTALFVATVYITVRVWPSYRGPYLPKDLVAKHLSATGTILAIALSITVIMWALLGANPPKVLITIYCAIAATALVINGIAYIDAK